MDLRIIYQASYQDEVFKWRIRLVYSAWTFFDSQRACSERDYCMRGERERKESQQAADNAVGTSASLCPGRRCQTALCIPRIPVPCQSVTSLTPYVAKYLCARVWAHGVCVCVCGGGEVLIPPLWDGPFAAFSFSLFPHLSSPSGPTLLSSSEPKFSWRANWLYSSRQESHVSHRGWRSTLLIDPPSSCTHTYALSDFFPFFFLSDSIPPKLVLTAQSALWEQHVHSF